MPIRINAAELLQVLALTPPTQNVLLVGKHGIGKSEILRDHYDRQGLKVVPLFLGQMSDPGDLIGLPAKDEASGHTIFLPPAWWPLDARPVALFLDELNRARPEILQSVHDLALNRTLAGRRLPEGSVVIAAINAGEEYQVTDLDPALASRFNIYEFQPEVEEWTVWARRAGLDGRVVAFIEQHNAFLDGGGQAGGDPLDKSPDRRAWTRVAQLLSGHEGITPLLNKAVAGIVGAQAALAFARFLTSQAGIKPEDVLLHFDDRVKAELLAQPLQGLSHLNRQILYYIEERVARDKMAPAQKKKIGAGVERYIDLLRQERRTEAVADFINQTEKAEFKRASGLLLASPRLMEVLTDYIDKVKL